VSSWCTEVGHTNYDVKAIRAPSLNHDISA
jgi:hypothetical protein